MKGFIKGDVKTVMIVIKSKEKNLLIGLSWLCSDSTKTYTRTGLLIAWSRSGSGMSVAR